VLRDDARESGLASQKTTFPTSPTILTATKTKRILCIQPKLGCSVIMIVLRVF